MANPPFQRSMSWLPARSPWSVASASVAAISDHQAGDGWLSRLEMEAFKALKTREALIEFEMVEGREGKPRAVRAVEFAWSPTH